MGVINQSLYRFLDTNGDGTGTKNANVNHAAAVEEYYIQPPNNRSFLIHRVMIYIEDDAVLSSEKYGGLATLTNGISVVVADAAGDRVDLTDGLPIQSNAHWARQAGPDVTPLDWGAGNNGVVIRWTFSKAGAPIRLDGGNSERLAFRLNDDFSGLTEHTFQVQGVDKNRVG